MGSSNESVHKFLLDYSEAYSQQDKKAVRALFALDDPRFSVFQDPMPGRVGSMDMLEIIDRLPSLQPKLYLEQIRVELLGDAALVTGFQLVRLTSQGQQRQTRMRLTMVLVQRGKDWRILHAHFSTMT